MLGFELLFQALAYRGGARDAGMGGGVAAGARACYELSRGRRWEPIFLISRTEERRIPGPPRTGRCPWGGYRVSASDEGQRDGENWPQPSGFHPIAQRPRAGDPGLRRKSPHTLLSSSTVDPPQPSDSASYGTIFPRNADRAKVHNRLLGYAWRIYIVTTRGAMIEANVSGNNWRLYIFRRPRVGGG